MTIPEFNSWKSENDLGLAVFTTPDCGVCNAIKPRIAEIAAEYDLLKVMYIDVGESPELSANHNVFVVPVLILMVKGKEARRFARHFGMQEIEDAIHRYAGLLAS